MALQQLESIATTQARITQFILENYAQADVAPGTVLSELLVKLAATVSNQVYNTIDNFSQGGSIQAATQSTTPTYSPVMDAVASNFLITRNAGQLSEGIAQITVSSSQNQFVAKGTLLSQPATGLQYATTEDWNVTATTPITSGELQIYFNADGTFYFLLPVTASAIGSGYQLAPNTTLVFVQGNAVSGLVSAVSYGNFSSGANQETDQQLVASLQTGITQRGLMSEASLQATLSASFPNILDVAVLGAGDAGLIRDKENLFAISTFGMADVYIRSAMGVESQTFQISGTKVSTGVWSLAMDYTNVPGFYSLLTLVPAGSPTAGSLPILTSSYGIVYPPGEPQNFLGTPTDAVFTQYQQYNATFSYTEPTTVPNGTTAYFVVTVNYAPNIRDCQLLVNNQTNRVASADYLIKGAIPCFISLNITVEQDTTQAAIPVAQLQQDIFNYINNLSFGQPIYASKIIALCFAYPGVERVVTPVTIKGSLQAPTGVVTNITSTDIFAPVSDPANYVDASVVAFYSSYGGSANGININVI